LSDTTNAIVAWARNGKILSRTRGGGGEGFEAVQTLSLAGQRSANPKAAIAPDGHTLVAWEAVSAKPRARQVLAYDSRTQNDQVLSTRGRFASDPVVAVGGDGFGSVAWAESRRSDLTGTSVALVSRQDGEGVFKTHGKRISTRGDGDSPRIDAGPRGDTVVITREEADDELGESWISAALASPGATKFGSSVTASGQGDVYDPGDVGVDATGGATLAWGANPGLTGVIQVVSAFYTP
jgi:hypothetical protein